MAITLIFAPESICLATDTSGRCHASKVDPKILSKLTYDRFSVAKHRCFRTGFRLERRRKLNVAVHASVPPEAPFPGDPSPGHWKFWILGTLVTILLSFSRGKWGPLLKLTEKVESTIEGAEQVSEVVEEVAEKVEKLAEEAAKLLPQGKLRDAAELVEDVAEEIDKDAHIAGDALEKVEEIEKDVESFLDSATHQEKAVVTAEPKDQK